MEKRSSQRKVYSKWLHFERKISHKKPKFILERTRKRRANQN